MYYVAFVILISITIACAVVSIRTKFSQNFWKESNCHGYVKGYLRWSLGRFIYVIGIMAFFTIIFLLINYRELTGNTTRGKVERDDREPVGSTRPLGDAERQVSAMTARSEGALSEVCPSSSADAVSSERKHTNLTVRLVNGSEEDYRAGAHVAREAHHNTIFRDIPFSEDKSSGIIDQACKDSRLFV